MAKQSQEFFRCTCGFESHGVDHFEPHPEILNGPGEHVMRRADVSYTIPSTPLNLSPFGSNLPSFGLDPMTDADDEFYRMPGYRSSTDDPGYRVYHG